MKNSQIHRLGDKVAVSLKGDGSTQYFTEKEARELAKAILSCAQHIKRSGFLQCNFGSVVIESREDRK